jgi:hypothetical protein
MVAVAGPNRTTMQSTTWSAVFNSPARRCKVTGDVHLHRENEHARSPGWPSRPGSVRSQSCTSMKGPPGPLHAMALVSRGNYRAVSLVLRQREC